MKLQIKILTLFICFSIASSNLCGDAYQETYKLYVAATKNDLELAKSAIESGALINAMTVDGLSLLHLAMITRSYDVAKLLVDSGINLEAEINYTYQSATPIILAVKLRDEAMINYLLESNATRDEKFIHTCIEYHLNDIFIKFMNKIYLELEMIDFHDNNQNATLHTAAEYNNEKIITWLIEHGADIHAINDDGDTPLHCAAKNQALDSIKLLIKYGASINAQNNSGETPIFLAVEKDFYDATALLIELGADVTIKDNYNLDLLYEAQKNNNLKMIELLALNGAMNIDENDSSDYEDNEDTK